jgi:hypothetical protein
MQKWKNPSLTLTFIPLMETPHFGMNAELSKAHRLNNHMKYTYFIWMQVKTVYHFTHYKKYRKKIKLDALVTLLIQRFLNQGHNPNFSYITLLKVIKWTWWLKTGCWISTGIWVAKPIWYTIISYGQKVVEPLY